MSFLLTGQKVVSWTRSSETVTATFSPILIVARSKPFA